MTADKVEIPTTNIEMASHGEYTITVTNKFTDKKKVYKQKNLLTDYWGIQLLKYGWLNDASRFTTVDENRVNTQSYMFLCTDEAEPYPDFQSKPSSNQNDYYKGNLGGYARLGHGSAIAQFGRPVEEYSLSGTNTNVWLGDNPPFPTIDAPTYLSGGEHSPIDILQLFNNYNSPSNSGRQHLKATPTPTRRTFSGGVGYIKVGRTARAFARTGAGASAGKVIKSIRVGYSGAQKIDHGYGGIYINEAPSEIISWAKLDTPITIQQGDIINVSWEAIIAIPGGGESYENSLETFTAFSPEVEVTVNEYAYGTDPSGVPDTTSPVDSRGKVSTRGLPFKTGSWSTYSSAKTTYESLSPLDNPTTSASQTVKCVLWGNDNTDFANWSANGYAVPSNNREAVEHTISYLAQSMNPGDATGPSDHSLGGTRSISVPPGYRVTYIRETSRRISWPAGGTPLDVSTLDPAVKTALGIV